MRPGMLLALGLALIFAIIAGCGPSGGSKNGSLTLKELHDPKLAATATLSGTPPAPLPANAVAGGVGGPQADTYVVKSGDTLGLIASSLGVAVEDLASANNITDPSRLQIGQQLKVPKSGAASPIPGVSGSAVSGPPLATVRPGASSQPGSQVPPTGGAPSGVSPRVSPTAVATPGGTVSTPAAAATQYTVKAGDSACAIAIQSGISVQELADANGLSKEQLQRLSVGQLLKIPPRTGNKGCS